MSLLVWLAAVSCAGPGAHVRGRHGGGFHHHHGGNPGPLALLEGLALFGSIVSDVAYVVELSNPTPPASALVPQLSRPEPVRPLPPRFQGRLFLPQSSRPTLPELRIGLRSAFAEAGTYQAIFNSDEMGRFQFAPPPSGSYILVVLDPEYEGGLSFATDGRSAFPLAIPIARRRR